jgi:hypothetical protein
MRLTNWRQRLMGPEGPVEQARAKHFAWKGNNCIAFAGRCVEAVTGENPYAPYDDACADEAEAMALLAENGCARIDDAAARFFPRHVEDDGSDAPGKARTGDLGIVERDGRRVLVVCLGPLCAAPGARSLMFSQRSELLSAFKVG